MPILPKSANVKTFFANRAQPLYDAAAFVVGYALSGVSRSLLEGAIHKTGEVGEVSETIETVTTFNPNFNYEGDLGGKLSAITGHDPLLGVGMGLAAIAGGRDKSWPYALVGLGVTHLYNLANLVREPSYAVADYVVETLTEAALVGGAYFLGYGIHKLKQKVMPAKTKGRPTPSSGSTP